MEKAINKKIEAIFMLNQYKDIVNSNRDKVGEYLGNECYFKQIEAELEGKKMILKN